MENPADQLGGFVRASFVSRKFAAFVWTDISNEAKSLPCAIEGIYALTRSIPSILRFACRKSPLLAQRAREKWGTRGFSSFFVHRGRMNTQDDRDMCRELEEMPR